MKKTPILDGMGWPRFASVVVTALALGVACSGDEGGGRQIDGNRPPGGSGSGSGSGTGGAILGSGGGGVILPGTGSTDGTGGDGPETKCDPVTGVCTCINIAVFGRQGTYGANPGADGQSAIQAWLNTNSSAAVDIFHTKPDLTPEFLGKYQVVILEALESAAGAGNQWALTPSDIDNFQAWVRAGGGVITLTGYSDQPTEAAPTNTLLQFSGLQYGGLTGPGDTSVASEPTCGYCLGNSDSQAGWVATHPIAANVTAVGAFLGRSVTVPAGGEIVAQEGGKVLGATVAVDSGRVFMFHDEWVTYTSQWDGSGLQYNCLTQLAGDPNHSCYNVHPTTTYQVPQFWYNALKWVSGDPQCFDITDPTIIK